MHRDLRTKAPFIRITAAVLRESHAHDVRSRMKRRTTESNRPIKAALPRALVGQASSIVAAESVIPT